MTDVIRRKIDRARLPPADGAPGADRAWRLALARSARDCVGLDLEVRSLSLRRMALAELPEIAPDLALVALLDGPEAGLGVVLVDPSLTSALIEVQTVGRLSPQPPAPRKPTRIDAAMTAGVIDRALTGLEEALADEEDGIWASGFRYASFLEDVRPLALLLEEEEYRILDAEVGLAGLRKGRMVLILPALGRSPRPLALAAPEAPPQPPFAQALAAQVMQADSRLEAVIDRLRLPLHQVMGLQEGQVLPLPRAALDRISVEALDGRRLAGGRLGQHRGMRAVKLADDLTHADRPASQATIPAPEDAAELPDLRAAG